jgi:Tol biopolymer transport system component
MVITALCVNPACGEKQTPPDFGPMPEWNQFDYNAVWSEEHDLIAFIHVRNNPDEHPDPSGIYVIRPDGTEKNLIFANNLSNGLDWSDDGRWLITDSWRQLIKISYPDGLADTIVSGGEHFDPVWSPDGRYIASIDRGGDDRGVHVMDEYGNDNRLVIRYGDHVDWPYQDSLLYLNFDTAYVVGRVYMADTSGLFRRQVFYPGDNFVYSTPIPKIHPQTRRIVFHAQEPGNAFSIWSYDSNGGEIKKIRNLANHPNFSPDGNQVVFTDLNEGRLWIINWDGTGLRQLTF